MAGGVAVFLAGSRKTRLRAFAFKNGPWAFDAFRFGSNATRVFFVLLGVRTVSEQSTI
jgi:hypothetical protein